MSLSREEYEYGEAVGFLPEELDKMAERVDGLPPFRIPAPPNEKDEKSVGEKVIGIFQEDKFKKIVKQDGSEASILCVSDDTGVRYNLWGQFGTPKGTPEKDRKNPSGTVTAVMQLRLAAKGSLVGRRFVAWKENYFNTKFKKVMSSVKMQLLQEGQDIKSPVRQTQLVDQQEQQKAKAANAKDAKAFM